MSTKPPRCGQEIPAHARAAAEALIAHHLNPLLHGRQKMTARIEAARAGGEGGVAETMALACLDVAYQDGLKLLRELAR